MGFGAVLVLFALIPLISKRFYTLSALASPVKRKASRDCEASSFFYPNYRISVLKNNRANFSGVLWRGSYLESWVITLVLGPWGLTNFPHLTVSAGTTPGGSRNAGSGRRPGRFNPGSSSGIEEKPPVADERIGDGGAGWNVLAGWIGSLR
jgi:hypothetical protein